MPSTPTVASPEASAPEPDNGESYVWWFLRRSLRSELGAKLEWEDIYKSFLAWWSDATWWCEAPRQSPSPQHFATMLASVCRQTGIRVEFAGKRFYCLDVTWKSPG